MLKTNALYLKTQRLIAETQRNTQRHIQRHRETHEEEQKETHRETHTHRIQRAASNVYRLPFLLLHT